MYREIPGSDLDDVVSAEHTASVASVSVLSDCALHLRGTRQKHHDFIIRQTITSKWSQVLCLNLHILL